MILDTWTVIVILIILMIFTWLALVIIKNLINFSKEKELNAETISDEMKIISLKNMYSSLNKLGIMNIKPNPDLSHQDLIKEFDHYFKYDLTELDKKSSKYIYYSEIKKFLNKELKFLSKL